jgi:hypothetical protein
VSQRRALAARRRLLAAEAVLQRVRLAHECELLTQHTRGAARWALPAAAGVLTLWRLLRLRTLPLRSLWQALRVR